MAGCRRHPPMNAVVDAVTWTADASRGRHASLTMSPP